MKFWGFDLGFADLFTTLNLVSGLLAIILVAYDERISIALVIAGLLFDFLDGRIARMQKKSTAFGAELDSLADVVTFGVAPAIITLIDGIGIITASLYVIGAAYRLARFNIEKKTKGFFGLPVPAAAVLLLLSSLMPIILFYCAQIIIATLMISRVRVPKL